MIVTKGPPYHDSRFASVPHARADRPSRRATLHLGWLPLPLFAASIAVLWALEPTAVHQSPFLLIALNIGFSTLVALFVAYLCARSFLATAEPGVLLLGCGVLVWGVESAFSALSIWRGGDFSVTIHSVGACVSGMCSLAGARLAGRARWTVRTPGPWVAAVYSAGILAVVLIVAATLEGWMPVFFVQGQGGTPVRQAVLGSAIGIFAATAAQMWRMDRRVPSTFLHWYALGLALLAIGFSGVWLQSVQDSLLGWTSRIAQFLGGSYLLIAGVATVREAQGWRVSLAEALRASQERYAAFAAAMFEGIVESDDGRIVSCNQQFAQMTGHSASELRGMTIANLVAPEHRDRVWAILAGNVESVTEHTMVRKDGSRIEVEAHGPPHTPGTMGRYTAVRDITERKRAEQRLERLTRLYAVLSRVNEAIVRIREERDLYRDVCQIIAEEGRFELVWIGEVEDRHVTPIASSGPATAYLKEIRVETDGPLGQGPTGTAVREARPVINDDFEINPSTAPWRDAALRHGFRASAAFPLRRQDTTIGVLTLYATAAGAFDAEVVRLLGALAADLSYALDALHHERLRTEAVERLRQSEERFRRSEERRKVAEAVRVERQRLFDLLETLPVMISLLTPDHQIVFANRGFRERFGASAGRRCFESCFGRTQPCEGCETYGVLATGKPHRWELPASEEMVLDVFALPFTDTDGSPMILEMNLDITERRRAERALHSAHQHLADRATQLRALAGELTLSEQRERRRLAGILHDHLQQLLVAAKYRTAVLGLTGDGPARQAAAEVEQLLDTSISAARTLTAELSPPMLRTGALPADLAWLVRWMADRHGLAVDLAVDEDLPPLEEDVRILLFESVRELLFNAAKHARVNRVDVAVRTVAGPGIAIIVSDAGPGFDPAQLKRAGEIGGGFGLFSIQERLELLGGHMKVDSAPGTGSQFTLTVRAAKPAVAVAPGVPAPPPPAAHAGPAEPPARGPSCRVLLADDHAVVREGLRRLFSGEPDIEIVGEAADGQEAIALAARLRPDVILMDVSMPHLDGIEAARAIHRDQPHIRIIGLSMYEDGPHAEDMRNAGAAGYFTKSGPPGDLIEAIRRAGRSSRPL